ncbi:RHS repeat-associated core domain-containing protein [Blastopirellula retiformator]|uniref:tRNA(Glu)-specific nuclease WapA n=1 Tax=Blastopirellula retiformator TaxID=2527970 RepID=A0A5C5V0V0_9BACT|nr:RHS repeat-associated core domain-containing protein [Blastopirellula retiformator]TWT32078.1 tRNA(Glu)-specific nuclease WapA precursor [Blastopirellula retiformator]
MIKEAIYDDQGNIVKVIEYNFGHDEISQTVTEYTGGVPVTPTTHIFGHDGHSSVKVLYDAAAAIAQVYTYEAYGQMLAIRNAIAGVVGTTEAAALTTLLYSGEQFDSRIGQQYLRARYYDPNSGRFNRLDPFAGNSQDPQSFHKYLYTHGNPVMGADPSGLSLTSLALGAQRYMSLQAARAQSAFAAGGTILGRYWQAVGRHTERFAQNVISMFRFEAVLRNQRVGRNLIDFILRRGDRIMQLEIKYSIPQKFGSSFTRLVNQITSMSNANGGNITVWSMRAPSVSTLNRLQRTLGDDLFNRVQFADGINGLYQVLRLYFGM